MRKFGAYKKQDPGDNGLNNASILTFSKDVVDALIKELTQNSIDAMDENADKVRVKVDMFELETSELEGFDEFEQILGKLSEYWTERNQDNFVKFFNNASDIVKSGKLHVFSFEDYNTTGLEGDQASGSFKNLVYDEGVSDNKPDNALGGFGIGKNSFFALTALQTVFYSSYHSERGHMFFGVSKLAEYVDAEYVRRNNRLYYGDWKDERVEHVSNSNLIPDKFKRNENGLSSYALGVIPVPNWQDLVIKALIKNYWFLFESNKIEAEIDGKIMNKDNYFEFAASVYEENNSILPFIQTYKKPDHIFSYNVHELGNVEVRLSEQPDNTSVDYPDKIVFIRDGMMIKEYNLGVRNLPNRVAGIMYCDNLEGNKILSKMEPPAHDNFEAFYLPKKHPSLTEEDGRKIISEIESSKKKAVRSLKDAYNQPTKQVGFIDELLSGLSVSTGSGKSVGKASPSDEESFDIVKKEGDVKLDVSSQVQTKTKRQRVKKQNQKQKKNRISRKATISSAKFYYSHTEDGLNHYLLIIYVDQAINKTNLKFTQHGDSPAKALSTEIVEVNNGTEKFSVIIHDSFFEIKGLKLKSKLKNKFNVVFKEDFKSAFKILK
jgi:hypothetical protein